MRGLGMAERSELQEPVSPPRQLGETVSVVTPELVQTKTEPGAPVTPLQTHRGCNVHGPGWGRTSRPSAHGERDTPNLTFTKNQLKT